MKFIKQNIKPLYQKTTAILCAMLMLASAGSSIGINSSFAAAKTYKTGDTFSEKGINSGKLAYVTNVLKADVNGDKKSDTLYVVGNRIDKDSMSYDQFSYFLVDGKSGKRSFYPLKNLEGYSGWGYEPVLELVDLDKDAVKDVQFTSYSGGSGGFTYYNIATFKGGKYTQLLGQKELNGIGLTGKYVDGFKAEMSCDGVDYKWYLDLNFQKSSLLEMNVYDKTGKVLTPVEPWSGPLVGVRVVNGYLSGTQSIKGLANADYLGNLNLTYVYEKGQLVLKEISLENPLKMEY
jgi:hypothetical protein